MITSREESIWDYVAFNFGMKIHTYKRHALSINKFETAVKKSMMLLSE